MFELILNENISLIFSPDQQGQPLCKESRQLIVEDGSKKGAEWQ